jgi:hypothetical protein
MIRLTIIVLSVMLIGCASAPVAVKSIDVLDFPSSLMLPCAEGLPVSSNLPFSKNLEIIVANNITWAECRLNHDSLIEAIKSRQQLAK